MSAHKSMPQQYFRPPIPGLQICDTISVFGVLFPTFYLCFPTFGFGLLISDFRLWIPYILFWSSEFLFRTIHFRLQSSDFGHSISEFGLLFSTFDYPFFGILISNLYLGFRTRNLNSDHWRIIFYLPAWHFSWNDDLRLLSLLRLICDGELLKFDCHSSVASCTLWSLIIGLPFFQFRLRSAIFNVHYVGRSNFLLESGIWNQFWWHFDRNFQAHKFTKIKPFKP